MWGMAGEDLWGESRNMWNCWISWQDVIYSHPFHGWTIYGHVCALGQTSEGADLFITMFYDRCNYLKGFSSLLTRCSCLLTSSVNYYPRVDTVALFSSFHIQDRTWNMTWLLIFVWLEHFLIFMWRNNRTQPSLLVLLKVKNPSLAGWVLGSQSPYRG